MKQKPFYTDYKTLIAVAFFGLYFCIGLLGLPL